MFTSDLNQTAIALKYFINGSDSLRISVKIRLESNSVAHCEGRCRRQYIVGLTASPGIFLSLFSFLRLGLCISKALTHSPKHVHEAEHDVRTGQR